MSAGMLRALLAGSALLVVMGCTSPEAARQRGSGTGADIGNRGEVIEIHAGARPYYKTECALAEVECEGPEPVFGPVAALE